MDLRKFTAFTFFLFLAPLLALAEPYSTADMPEASRKWAYYEQQVNKRHGSTFLMSDDTYGNLPAAYDPIHQPVFEISYIEIPAAEAKADISGLSKSAQEVLLVEKEGKQYYRFFIHPLMEDRHEQAIKKYGIVRGEYLASPTSSPRSLWVWQKGSDNVVGQKVSLGIEISGLVRLNPTDKLNRAQATTRALQGIPEEVRKAYGFHFIPEALTIQAPDKAYGTITRDFSEGFAHPNGNPKFLAGTSLLSPDPKGAEPLFVQFLKESKKKPQAFVEEDILRPLMRSYGYIMFQEGYSTEPHVQNLLYNLDENGRLTGEVTYRDLDSFKADLELRNMRGRDSSPFQWLDRPYKTLKLNKATEYYDNSYLFYARGDWGEHIEAMLKAAGKPVNFNVWELYDRMMLVEATRHLGSEAVFGDKLKEFFGRNRARLEKLYPHVDPEKPVLTAAEVEDFLKKFGVKDVMGAESTAREIPFKVQDFIQRYQQQTLARNAAPR